MTQDEIIGGTLARELAEALIAHGIFKNQVEAALQGRDYVFIFELARDLLPEGEFEEIRCQVWEFEQDMLADAQMGEKYVPGDDEDYKYASGE